MIYLSTAFLCFLPVLPDFRDLFEVHELIPEDSLELLFWPALLQLAASALASKAETATF